MGKILLYVSILFSLITAALGFLNHGTLVQTKDTLAQTESKLSQTTATLATTEANLKKSQGELSAVNTEKESLATQLTASQQKASTAEAQVGQLNTQVTEKTTQITQLETDIKAKNDRIAELEKNPAQDSTAQIQELQTQIQEKEALVTSLQTQLDSAKGQIKDYEQKDKDRLAKTMKKGLEGRVLAVNNAWNFVVLSLGDRNGIVNNAEMLVKRGTQLIGKVRITSVEPSSSIADIVSNKSGEVSIQPGDNVIYQGE